MAHAPKKPDSPLFDLYLRPFFLSLVLAGVLGWTADYLRHLDAGPQSVQPSPEASTQPDRSIPHSVPAQHTPPALSRS